jgi:hypothetical protein
MTPNVVTSRLSARNDEPEPTLGEVQNHAAAGGSEFTDGQMHARL